MGSVLALSHAQTHTASPRPLVKQTPRDGNRLDDCLAHASQRRLQAKEFVFVDGDPAKHIYRIEVGAVSLFKILPDGRRQILGFGCRQMVP